MIFPSHDSCMIFSNDEIRTYFICELEKCNITCSCIVGERYVNKDVAENYDYITFDGEKQDFFISFSRGEASIFINDDEIMFIDDNEKRYYTIEDTYDNIVYEGSLTELSHKEILMKLVSIIKLLYGSRKMRVLKKPLPNQNLLYPRFDYKLLLENPFIQCGIYQFDNIVIEINS